MKEKVNCKSALKIKKKDIHKMEVNRDGSCTTFFISAIDNKVNFHMEYSEVDLTLTEVDELIAILKQVKKDAIK